MPPTARWLQIHTVDQPDVHRYINAMRRISDGYPERVMIGEAYLPIDRLMAYYGVDLTGFHLPFNFHLITTAWQPESVAALIKLYEAALPAGGWPNWVLGNHDRSRVASRVGRAQARIAAMLLLTLRGTPTIYQGEELGMMDVAIPAHQVQDPLELNVPGFGLGRDPVRTPMPWDGSQHAGFTTGDPWLPLNADAHVLNVASQTIDTKSIWSLYKALITLRRASSALSVGAFEVISTDGGILAYRRHFERERMLIMLNMSDREQALKAEGAVGTVMLSTYLDMPSPSHTRGVLRANEGLIIKM